MQAAVPGNGRTQAWKDVLQIFRNQNLEEIFTFISAFWYFCTCQCVRTLNPSFDGGVWPRVYGGGGEGVKQKIPIQCDLVLVKRHPGLIHFCQAIHQQFLVSFSDQFHVKTMIDMETDLKSCISFVFVLVYACNSSLLLLWHKTVIWLAEVLVGYIIYYVFCNEMKISPEDIRFFSDNRRIVGNVDFEDEQNQQEILRL